VYNGIIRLILYLMLITTAPISQLYWVTDRLNYRIDIGYLIGRMEPEIGILLKLLVGKKDLIE